MRRAIIGRPHLLRSPLAGGRSGRGRKAPIRAEQTRLRVDQELARHHDLLACLQAGQHDDLIAALRPQLHFDRPVTTCALGDEDDVAAAGADHRLGRRQQYVALRAAEHGDVGVHARLEQAPGIVENKPQAQRSGGVIEHGIDVVHRPLEDLPRQRLEPRLGGPVLAHPARLRFRNLDDHPDSRQVHELHQRRAGRDLRTLTHSQIHDEARLRRVDRRGAAVAGNAAEEFQALRRGLDQQRVAAVLRQLEFLHRRIQVRRVQRGDALAFLHRIAFGAHVKLFDPAGGARLHSDDPALVDAYRADGVHALPERAGLHRRRAHAQVLRHLRIDRDDGAAVRCARFGVLGHQLHVHVRRLAGLIEVDLRLHRVVPVQHFAVRAPGPCLRGGWRVLPTHQLHAADRAVARLVLPHLRMHRAGVIGLALLVSHFHKLMPVRRIGLGPPPAAGAEGRDQHDAGGDPDSVVHRKHFLQEFR
ncbi:MAG: hypothetical protein WC809_00215 [Sinimarinibacterium sp.]|jgi:hypothetical protein